MKRRIAFAAALLITVMFAFGSGIYAENGAPSLFLNDEEWYKDSIHPLIIRDGICHVPAEIFSMFEYIGVTTEQNGNLLIENKNDENYISLLFRNRTAIINGKLENHIGIFRSDGMYYVEAELVCDTLGISYEYYNHSNGDISMRLYDGDAMYDFNTLLRSYIVSGAYPGDSGDGDEAVKKIYVLCKQPDHSADNQFPAAEILEYYNVSYTMFLSDPEITEDVLEAVSQGEYGVYASNYGDVSLKEAVDDVNSKAMEITHRISRLTLKTDDAEEPAEYYAIAPDFTVNGAISYDTVYYQIKEYLNTHDYCTLLLEDSWNSQQMIIKLAELDDESIITSNIDSSQYRY